MSSTNIIDKNYEVIGPSFSPRNDEERELIKKAASDKVIHHTEPYNRVLTREDGDS